MQEKQQVYRHTRGSDILVYREWTIRHSYFIDGEYFLVHKAPKCQRINCFSDPARNTVASCEHEPPNRVKLVWRLLQS